MQEKKFTTGDISSFGARLRSFRESKRLTQDRLAEILGISRTAITQYERDRKLPSVGVLLRLASEMDVDVGLLLTGRAAGKTDPRDLPQPLVRFTSSLESRPGEVRTEDYRAVPLLADPAAAGAPLISTDLVEEWAWIHASQVGRRTNLAAFRIDGDSMTPLIRDGDIVAIDRDDVHPPGLFAARVDEGVTVKRVKLLAGALLLTPENRAYEERLLEIPRGGSLGDVLIGRVVWQWSDLTGR